MSEDLLTLLRAKKIDILYDQGILVLSGSFFVALIMGFIFWSKVPTNILLSWFVVFSLLSATRAFSVYQYRRSDVPAEKSTRWLYGYNLGTLISGLLWASLGIFLIRHTDSYDAIIVFACLIGLVATATATYSVSLVTYVIFSTSTLLIPFSYLFIQTNTFLTPLVYFLIIFYCFMLGTTWRLNLTLTKSLSYEFENRQLLEQLKEEKQSVSTLNKELQVDIEGRMRTLARLMNEKVKAERLAEKLSALSSKDGLTGIDNRRRFDEQLLNEWKRSIRSKTPLSLIMGDIDYFKPYNDLYGHQQGDECLCRVAHLLEDYSRRGSDTAARYGGEEFTIILSDTDEEHAHEIAELIRIAIEDLQIQHSASNIKDYVTMSFGVATMIPTKEQSPDILIKCADKAMYKAKSLGRNQVATANLTIN